MGVVIDRSLIGGERRETQRIEGYRRFEAPGFAPPVDLREESLAPASAEMLNAPVERAMESVAEYLAIVFGGSSDQAARSRLGDDLLSYVAGGPLQRAIW